MRMKSYPANTTNMSSVSPASAISKEYNDYDIDLEREMARYRLTRTVTEGPQRNVNDSEATQGTVFWLPAKDDLPERAVRRAHGKGAVEEGIYNHPVVAISRPSDENDTVHFHLARILLQCDKDQ
jgi:hypothetical protein